MHNIYVLHRDREKRWAREESICTRNYSTFKWMHHVTAMGTGNVFDVSVKSIDAYTNVERISIFAIFSGDRRNRRVAATKLTYKNKKTLI